jgi:hypothetical protein
MLVAAQEIAAEIRGAQQREPAELLDEAIVERAAGDGKDDGRRDIKNLLESGVHEAAGGECGSWRLTDKLPANQPGMRSLRRWLKQKGRAHLPMRPALIQH